MATVSKLSVALAIEPTGFGKGLQVATDKLKGFADKMPQVFGTGVTGAIEKATAKFKAFGLRLPGLLKKGAVLAGGVLGAGLLAFGKGFFKVNKNFQTLKVTLNQLTNGGAKQAFADISAFASASPFELEKVASAWVKLKTFGFDPSIETLTNLGNVASGLGVPLEKVTGAMTAASTGSLSAFKKLGFGVEETKDGLIVSFQGVEQLIGNNAASIGLFLNQLGRNRFGDAMSQQLLTAAGSTTALNNAMDVLRIQVGEASGINAGINALKKALTGLIQKFITPENIKSFFAVIETGLSYFFKAIESITNALGYVFALFNLDDLAGGIGGQSGLDALKAGQDFAKGIEMEDPFKLGQVNPEQKESKFEELKRLQAEAVEESKKQTDALGRLADKGFAAVAS